MVIRKAHELAGGDLLQGPRGAAPDCGNAVLSLRTQVADYTLDSERMALLCAWNGRQEVAVEGRRLAVDDDTWLAVPMGPAHVRIRGSCEVQALTILFRRGMPEEVLGVLLSNDDRLLEHGEASYAPSTPFMPHLYTHDRSVTPVLLFIRGHCDMGLEDELWYEEQLAFLLERMLVRHRQILARARAVPVRRATTRREILRRVLLATDFIHSNYDKPLMLSDMARAAFLSRHHFLRLFKNIHEVTPHEYLQRKRTSVAARLLRSSDMSVEEIVRRVGFDSRSTLFRALRRFHGVTPRECRRASEAPKFMSVGEGAAA
ncbi:MAG TPA: AraC family transcriptional regulator [Steroidobacter sp.]|nr:AraC family transcriptional regulator [Steroidobacteraceae bacterium]HLS82622.1 AraC family transcriptional regulator [Steroidobacter sp.]